MFFSTLNEDDGWKKNADRLDPPKSPEIFLKTNI